MSRRVQLIRHSTGAADAFVGLQGEISVDITKKEFRLGDGLTAGGIPQARADLDNVDGATTSVDGKLVASDKQKLAFLTLTQAVDLDAMEIDVIAALLDIVAIELKTDLITITQSVNLDTIEADVATAAAELAFIAITQAVDLDTMESNIATNNAKISYPDAAVVAASKVITDWISVTQAVNLDTMESNIAANNAKVTNATHSGHVSGSGTLTLLVAAITGQTNTSTLTGTDEFLVNDGGAIRRVDMNRFIVGQATALASGLVSTDELLVSDAGVLKRMDVSVLEAYLLTTSKIGTVIANMAIGSVGTYAQVARPNGSGGLTQGATYAGSNLRYASSDFSQGGAALAGNSGSTPSGTWRIMGKGHDLYNSGSSATVTLALRIS